MATLVILQKAACFFVRPQEAVLVVDNAKAMTIADVQHAVRMY